MSESNGVVATPRKVPQPETNGQADKVSLQSVLLDVVRREMSEDGSCDTNKVLAVIRKKIEALPQSQRPDAVLDRQKVHATVYKVKQERRSGKTVTVPVTAIVSALSHPSPATVPLPASLPAFTAEQLAKAKTFLDSCPSSDHAAAALNVVTALCTGKEVLS